MYIQCISTQYAAVMWLSGNELLSINIVTLNVVTLRWARLHVVLGWVTICRQVNHLSMSI